MNLVRLNTDQVDIDYAATDMATTAISVIEVPDEL